MLIWVMLLPATVNTWPPVPVPAAMALPAATTTLPVPLLMILGAVTLPVPDVLTSTPALLFWVMSAFAPDMMNALDVSFPPVLMVSAPVVTLMLASGSRFTLAPVPADVP